MDAKIPRNRKNLRVRRKTYTGAGYPLPHTKAVDALANSNYDSCGAIAKSPSRIQLCAHRIDRICQTFIPSFLNHTFHEIRTLSRSADESLLAHVNGCTFGTH